MTAIQINKRRSFRIKRFQYLIFLGFLVLVIASCKKESSKANLAILMTDAPANFKAVTIDLQGVEVTSDGGSAFVLNVNAGLYNLLDFSNGLSTLIATGDLDAGTVSQIRLILGPNSTVTVGNVVYPLSTPSAMQSGLKIQIHQTFEAGVSYSILLDFDANQSIVLKGNNEYQLKPVIRAIDTAISGSISGSITPVGLIATVIATSNGINYSTHTNANGTFLISGLPAGNYDITVTPDLPLNPVTKTNISVTVGISTNVGVMAL